MNLQWSDLLAAVALLLVLEGLLPFVNPAGTRRVFQQMSQMQDRELRVAGFIAIAAGLLLLFIVRS